MKFTWTIKELGPLINGGENKKADRINALKMSRACIIERKSELNPYSPLSRALANSLSTLNSMLEKEGVISNGNILID